MSARVMLTYDPIVEARRLWEKRGWGAAAPGMALITSLVRVEQVFVIRIEQQLRPLGLSLARYQVLMELASSESGELALNTLRKRMHVRQSAITNSVDRLVADGWVLRLPHPTDRRTTLARVTPEGLSTAQTALEVLAQQVDASLDLPPDKVDRLVGLLESVRSAADDLRPQGS